MEDKIAYLIVILLCSWLIIIIALVSLWFAWRKIKAQKEEIGELKKVRLTQSNRLREKGCDIDRLERTIANLKKQGMRL